MKRRDTQGSFIALMWMLIAKVNEITSVRVLIHPRAGLVASLLLGPVLLRSTQRRQAEEVRLAGKIYRFSSVENATGSCWRVAG